MKAAQEWLSLCSADAAYIGWARGWICTQWGWNFWLFLDTAFAYSPQVLVEESLKGAGRSGIQGGA